MGQTTRFIRMTELKEKVALSRSQIYKLIQQGEFPEPIKLGKKISVWTDHEVEEWMSSKLPTQH
jgi:prophage regulatory protein